MNTIRYFRFILCILIFEVFPCFGDAFMHKVLQEDFYKLEGKKTEYWKNLTRDEDLLLLKNIASLYNRNKAALETSGYEEKIPRKIHFIWLGPSPFPHLSVENVRNWIARHPDWECIFWTDRDRLAPCEGMVVKRVDPLLFSYLRKEFETAETWGEKSDILRYEILYQEGGIYVDHDADCLRSFEPIVQNYRLAAGLQVPRESIFATGMRSVTIANGLIAVAPKHPSILRCMEILHGRWDEDFSKLSVFEKTIVRSYLPFSLAMEEEIARSSKDTIIFPAAFFYPQSSLQPLFSVHSFAAAWLPLKDAANRDALKVQASLRTLEKKIYLLTGAQIILCGMLAMIGIFFFLRNKSNKVLFSFLLMMSLSASLFCSPKEDFEELMGRSSSETWKWVKTPDDRKWLAQFNEYYSAAPPALDLDYRNLKIPQTLHFIWLCANPPHEIFIKNIQSWIDYHPGWNVKIWTEGQTFPINGKISWADVRLLPKTFSNIDTDVLHPLEYQEIVRLSILLYEGGVVLDPQLQCRHSLKSLNGRYDFYTSLEVPKKTFLGSSIAFSSYIIASKPQHSFVRIALEGLLMRWEMVKKSDPGADVKTLKRLAQRRLDDALKRAFKLCSAQTRGTSIVLPAGYFHNVGSKKGIFATRKGVNMAWTSDADILADYGSTVKKLKKKTMWLSGFTIFLGIAAMATCYFVAAPLFRKNG